MRSSLSRSTLSVTSISSRRGRAGLLQRAGGRCPQNRAGAAAAPPHSPPCGIGAPPSASQRARAACRPAPAPSGPIGTIKPVSSATGMKRSGITSSPSSAASAAAPRSPRCRRVARLPGAGSGAASRCVPARGAAVLDAQPLGDPVVELGVKNWEGVAALVLGVIHGRLGVLQQGLRVAGVVGVGRCRCSV